MNEKVITDSFVKHITFRTNSGFEMSMTSINVSVVSVTRVGLEISCERLIEVHRSLSARDSGLVDSRLQFKSPAMIMSLRSVRA